MPQLQNGKVGLVQLPFARIGSCITAGLLLLIVAGTVAAHFLDPNLLGDLSVYAVAERIRSWGAWGVAGSIGLMVLHALVPFPAEVLAIANGIVYGPVWGTVVTWVGAMLGAYLTFGLVRWAARPAVHLMIGPKRREHLEVWSASHNGAAALLAARLIPVIAFNLVNCAAGLMNVSWWTFTWTTAIGILPMTVLTAAIGAYMLELPWWSWPLLAAMAPAAWVSMHRLRKSTRPDARRTSG